MSDDSPSPIPDDNYAALVIVDALARLIASRKHRKNYGCFKGEDAQEIQLYEKTEIKDESQKSLDSLSYRTIEERP